MGRQGEALAAGHLKRCGYRILAANVRNRFGEIDLVARAPDQNTLVIVEVKTSAGGGPRPEVHVNRDKQRHLTALAAQLVRRHRLQHRAIRFDVIGVELPADGEPRLRHTAGAFESSI